MFAGAVAVLLANVPLLPRLSFLRPRYGSFPLLLAALCLLWIGLLRYALPGFGRRQVFAACGLCLLLVLSWLPRAAGRGWGAPFLTASYYNYVILPTTAVQVAMLVGILTAPLWVPIGRLIRWWLKRRIAPGQVSEKEPAPIAEAAPAAEPAPPLGAPPRLWLSRRAVLSSVPWLLPGGAFAATAYGSFIESRKVVLRRLRMSVPNLPTALHGFRIGQVTDIHVARDLTQIHHLERGLQLLTQERLDILCATGDLCDEPRQYATVLRLLSQVPARLGHFGCIGNHELFMGLDVVRRAYDRSPVQLLEDDSVRLGALRLGGIGYAVRGRTFSLPDVPTQLDESLRARQPDEPTTTVMLAHHPHAITQVGARNIALMLSGHTHGGQLGLGDGSAIERFYPYARGLYRTPAKAAAELQPAAARTPDQAQMQAQAGAQAQTSTQLFVSSGLGHWLPVRLNCPPEVVLIELVPA